ncbi:MAG: cytochrome c3 family protein [Caldilineaceae bacterium]|nr:cytochrome c3 family protein [Caldilineaceae bacterium]
MFDRNADGIHAQHIVEGNLEAATCEDCHGNHAIQNPDEPRERVSQTCGNCHSTINEQYGGSVHGAALLGEDNPDVPICTDCHGVHNIPDPTTAEFRLSSPYMCGRCHADQELMDKYGISTDVFDTYVADFHGTTVTLFDHQSPHEESNKAVCYDCHGVHNILPASDENSQVIKQNLLVTCQQCHPDANDNFPNSWTSHFKPSIEHNPLVYFVDLFYLIVIPATVGGFLLFIGSDIFRQVRERFQRKSKESHDE